MTIQICERCREQTARINKCDYCNKKMCLTCIKSAKKPEKTRRLFICKDCWTDMPKRKRFKAT